MELAAGETRRLGPEPRTRSGAFWRSIYEGVGGGGARCLGCGLGFAASSETDRATHRRIHRQRVGQVHNMDTRTREDGVYLVREGTSSGLQAAAYRLGFLLKREIRIDFNPVPAPGTWEDGKEWYGTPKELHCFVALRDHWAVGLLVARYAQANHSLSLHSVVSRGEAETLWCMADVYVLPPYRREGIATGMVRHAQEHNRMDRYCWGGPLTDAGEGLAFALSGGDRVLLGA